MQKSLKTASGNVYEVSEPVALVAVVVQPQVLVMRDRARYLLSIEGIGETLPCRKLGAKVPEVATSRGLRQPTPKAIQSYIESDFDGLDYGKIFKLANGQVWQQVEHWLWVWIWTNPT